MKPREDWIDELARTGRAGFEAKVAAAEGGLVALCLTFGQRWVEVGRGADLPAVLRAARGTELWRLGAPCEIRAAIPDGRVWRLRPDGRWELVAAKGAAA